MNGKVVFFILSALAILTALGVVGYGNNPVRSAIMLVVNFFVLAIMYFVLGAQLLGITQIMVYAGAIMVLFLFVIMILQDAKGMKTADKTDLRQVGAWLGGLVLVGVVYGLVVFPWTGVRGGSSRVDPVFGTPQAVGYTLFTTYAWPFLVASVLLLVGIVGSILLAKRRI